MCCTLVYGWWEAHADKGKCYSLELETAYSGELELKIRLIKCEIRLSLKA